MLIDFGKLKPIIKLISRFEILGFFPYNIFMQNLTLVQTMALNDVQASYDKIILRSTGFYEKSIMGMFSYIKEKQLFEDDFFEYWFVKLLNAPTSIGCFYLDEPNYKIFGFSEKTIGIVLSSHLLFLQNACYYTEMSEMLSHALNNACVLEPGFFNLLTTDMISEHDMEIYKEKNKFNTEKYLQKVFPLKSDIHGVKI